MLKATEEEVEEIREYFEWQAPDLEVTFMQKVYSEAVLNTRHDSPIDPVSQNEQQPVENTVAAK